MQIRPQWDVSLHQEPVCTFMSGLKQYPKRHPKLKLLFSLQLLIVYHLLNLLFYHNSMSSKKLPLVCQGERRDFVTKKCGIADGFFASCFRRENRTYGLVCAAVVKRLFLRLPGLLIVGTNKEGKIRCAHYTVLRTPLLMYAGSVGRSVKIPDLK